MRKAIDDEDDHDDDNWKTGDAGVPCSSSSSILGSWSANKKKKERKIEHDNEDEHD
jgi:hypothetical protein